MEQELIDYTKILIFQLACSHKIDHRGYNNFNYEKSNLLKSLHETNDCEKAIKNVIYELVENEMFNKLLNRFIDIENKYKNIVNNKNNEENKKNKQDDEDEDEEDDEEEDEDEEKYEIKTELFDYFVKNVGVYEIFNLHQDNVDFFQYNFIECIKKHLLN